MQINRFKVALAISLLAAAGTQAETNTTRSRERLERQVRHELVMLPYYGVFDRFAYQVDGEKVTLFGEVTRPVLKRDAEEVVKAIEGVRSVDNQIEVLPLSSHDDRIRLVFTRRFMATSR